MPIAAKKFKKPLIQPSIKKWDNIDRAKTFGGRPLEQKYERSKKPTGHEKRLLLHNCCFTDHLP